MRQDYCGIGNCYLHGEFEWKGYYSPISFEIVKTDEYKNCDKLYYENKVLIARIRCPICGRSEAVEVEKDRNT